MKTNKDILLELVEKSRTGFMKTLLGRKYKFLRDWISERTPKLNGGSFSWKTKIYWVLNDLIGETEPEKFEFVQNGRAYIYEDCRKLIYGRKRV